MGGADFRWLDTGEEGFVLQIHDSDEGRSIAIVPELSVPPVRVEAFSRAGFHPSDDGIFLRPGGTIRYGDVRELFPNVSVRVMRRDDVFVSVPVKDAADRSVPPTVEAETPQVAVSAASETFFEDIRKPNEFQVPYKTGSRLGKPIAMIPVNMAAATQKALEDVASEHGAVDAFVADALGFDMLTLEKALSPEQIDAVALGWAAFLKGREFLLADQTGLGKGRVLAALALAAARAGKRDVFITEKANLFSDFWRDLMDTGASDEFGEPFILNAGSKIIDVTSKDGDVLFQSGKPKDINAIVKSGSLPDDARLMMASYSQFNREGSPKVSFLSNVVEGAAVIRDETHNGAGDSNTSVALQRALSNAWAVAHSSATFARTPRNLLAYGGILPPSLRGENASDLFDSGGNALAEALSQYLAEDGVLIRREHDLSEISLDVVIDEERIDRNRDLADRLAPILSRMAHLQRLVEDEIEVRNDDQANYKGNWYTANFGSRLGAIIRQFTTALSVDQCVDRCVSSLLNGEKPVVVIESTMESLMRELNSDGDTGPSEESEIDVEAGPPTFKDALRLLLSRIMQMSVKTTPASDPDRIPVEDEFIVAKASNIEALIDGFPDLSLSPIDDIRDRVEAVGGKLFEEGKIKNRWFADEISARKMRIQKGAYVPMPLVDRNNVIVGFNGGGLDMVVITRAASTGLSLHASERVADKRRRRMIEAQIAVNVVERVQFWGRVNRRGQVSTPAFETLCTGLPLQMRTMAMENRKLEKLSANVSANSANASAMKIPDVLDSVGNDVARNMLEEKPSLAQRMCIAMKIEDQEQAATELYHVNKLLQRLCLLPSAEQDEIFGQLLREYNDAVKAMEARGESPRGIRQVEGVWTEVSREPYEPGDPKDGKVFGRPVDLVVMECVRNASPLSASMIKEKIISSRRRLGEESGAAAGPYFDGQYKAIKSAKQRVLNAALAGRFISVKSALADRKPNAVKTADRKLADLTDAVQILKPGGEIMVPAAERGPVRSVIVDVQAPEKDEVHLPGCWSVIVAVPGESRWKTVSLATVLKGGGYSLISSGRGANLPNLSSFDRAPSGEVRERREFLDGNLVKAVMIASDVKAGSMVTIQKQDGSLERSVLLRRGGRNALFDRSRKANEPKEAIQVLLSGRPVFTKTMDRQEGLVIEREDQGFRESNTFIVSIPRGKAGKKYEESPMATHCGAFRGEGNFRIARIQSHQIECFLAEMLKNDFPIHFDPPGRDNSDRVSAKPRFGGRGPGR
ncbi:strawberry notch C-terminal domain-containing protein [Roseibium sp. RKSG952]|uniref:strawberry notch C-terminal domain-containing protein n=1 Tax=Roseibium sp. RKSG952 TaxID=2529384 RepID=UPI0012BBC31E|nr:strawberry notch C-terminal domain-containing protein [Roseibium sp. RKSG952]MTH96198.1 helicase [Roseibium sp. RKSG952]